MKAMEYLGIELGSTRIKAVVIGENGAVIAKGDHAWENRLLGDSVWTYDLDDAVSTPTGDDVAMVHCNNGCGELDMWVRLFGGDYAALFSEAMEKGEPDCGGIRPRTGTSFCKVESPALRTSSNGTFKGDA